MIAIIVPSRDMVHADFAMSLANLLTYTNNRVGKAFVLNVKGSSIDKLRNEGVKQALQVEEVTHICFIDSDQTFHYDAIEKLIAHDKPIVGAASVRREPPIQLTAIREDGTTLVLDPQKDTNLIRVKSNGFSLQLIKREIFEKMTFPWFESLYFDRGKIYEYISEDQNFCKTARTIYGYLIMVDPVVSADVGHLGTFNYNIHCQGLELDS